MYLCSFSLAYVNIDCLGSNPGLGMNYLNTAFLITNNINTNLNCKLMIAEKSQFNLLN